MPGSPLRIFSDLHFRDPRGELHDLADFSPLLGDAERVVFNGDSLDTQVPAMARHADELLDFTRRSGRVIDWLSGNHDPDFSERAELSLCDGRLGGPHDPHRVRVLVYAVVLLLLAVELAVKQLAVVVHCVALRRPMLDLRADLGGCAGAAVVALPSCTQATATTRATKGNATAAATATSQTIGPLRTTTTTDVCRDVFAQIIRLQRFNHIWF